MSTTAAQTKFQRNSRTPVSCFGYVPTLISRNDLRIGFGSIRRSVICITGARGHRTQKVLMKETTAHYIPNVVLEV